MPSQAEIRASRTKPKRKARQQATRRKPVPVELWPSLGGVACDWIETFCVSGPGDVRGMAAQLTNEERLFIWNAYEVHPVTGRRRWDRAAYVRVKGTRKTELSDWLSMFELCGPSRCDGFDADGNPVGVPVTSPFIPIATTSREQSDDTLWGAIYASVTEGPMIDAYALDVTIDGIVELATGGEMKPVTAKAISKDGGKPTFSPRDETHLWYQVGLTNFNDTLLRNLAKRKVGEPWSLSTTTAWAPKQGSVAESEWLEVEAARAAGHQPPLLWDMRSASPHHDLGSDRGLRDAIIEAAGDFAEFVDVEKRMRDFRRGSPADGKRYWLNIPTAITEDESWLRAHPDAYEECRVPGVALDPDGESVSVGVDAAIRSDSVAVRALQHQPDGTVVGVGRTWVAVDGRNYDRAALRNHLRELCAKYPVKAIGYDPAFIESDAQNLLDEGLPMVEVPQSSQRMVPACRLGYELIVDRRFRHDDDEATSDQMVAGVPREADGGWRLSKGKSARKIDAGVAYAIAAYVDELVTVEAPLVGGYIGADA